MSEEKRNAFNAFDEFSFEAITALGNLMQCKELCRNQRAVMKINRFRAWLMDLQPEKDVQQDLPFGEGFADQQGDNN